MNLLAELLGETEWGELADAFRRKVPLVRAEGRPGRFRRLWSDWELDAMCRFTPLPETELFRLFAQGKQVPAATFVDRRGSASLETLRKLWASGVSINFARLEQLSNPVLALVRGLEAALRAPGRVHFFATPGHAQALGAHADHADVLVLQLQGEKTWDVYTRTPAWRPGGPSKEAALKDQVPETVTLREGGWLYLPLGVYHEVRNTADQPSTHVTIGFHPLTWSALIARAVEVAADAPPELAEPVIVAGPLEASEAEIARRFQALRPFLDAALKADRYGVPVPPDALVPRERLDAVDASTRFAWRRDEVSVHTAAGRAQLRLAYRATPFVLRAEFQPASEAMISRDSFCAADLPLDAPTALLLCKFLLNVGVVRLAA